MHSRSACLCPLQAVSPARLSCPRRLIAESLAAFRRTMSAMEKADCWRDGLWPRNYRCQIRAPERADVGPAAR